MADHPHKPEDDSFTADILASAAHSAVRMPYDGVRQLVNKASNKTIGQDILPKISIFEAPEEAPFGTARWHGQQIGSAAGMAVPMFAMTRAFGVKLFAPSGSSILAQSGKGALAGASYDFLFRPTQEGPEFWHQRMENAAFGGLTMAAIAGSGGVITKVWAKHSKAAVPELAYSLRHQVLTGAASGGVGGFVHAEAESVWRTGKPAEREDVLKSMYGFAFTGGAMGGLHRAADRLGERARYSMDRYFEQNKVLGAEPGIDSPMLRLIAEEKIQPGRAKDAKQLREIIDSENPLNWSPQEQARVLSELRRNASGSRFASEKALDAFVRILNKQAKNLADPELAGMAEKNRELREAYVEADQNLQDVIVSKDATRLAGDRTLADPEFQRAHPEYKAALEIKNEKQRAFENQSKVFESRKAAAEQNVQMALNEFTRAYGLPPIKVTFDAYVDVAGYWFGRREMSVGYSNADGFSARQAEVLLHELVHYEQDVVRMKLRADKMGIGRVATAEQMAEFKRQEEATVGAFDEKFFNEVIRRRNGVPLSREEAARAEQFDLRRGEDPSQKQMHERVRHSELQRELELIDGNADGALRLARRYTVDKFWKGDNPVLKAEELFGDQYRAVEPIFDQVGKMAERTRKPPAGWDEAANKRLLRQVIEEQMGKARENGRKHFFDYVRQPHEVEAYSVGLLLNLKARAMGVKPEQAGSQPEQTGTHT